MTDQHTWQSSLAEWPNNTPAFRLGWLTNQHISLSLQVDWLPIRANWLTNILLPMYMYIYLGWLPFSLIDHHACVPVVHTCLVNYWPTYMPTYLSWLRNISAFLSCLKYQGWLTDHCTCLPTWADSYQSCWLWLTDWPTDIPVYLSGLTWIKKHGCLPVWLTILPS